MIRKLFVMSIPMVLIFTGIMACSDGKNKGLVTITGKIEIVTSHTDLNSVPEARREAFRYISVVKEDGARVIISAGDPAHSELKANDGKTATLTGTLDPERTYFKNEQLDLLKLKEIKEIK